MNSGYPLIGVSKGTYRAKNALFFRLKISPKTPSYTNIDSINGKSMFNLVGKHLYVVERLIVDAKKGHHNWIAAPTRLFSSQYDSKSTSVNINASYTEALLGKKLIRCKIYFLRIFFIYRPSYIDVFQEICFSYFLDVFSRSLSTRMSLIKMKYTFSIYSSSYAHENI